MAERKVSVVLTAQDQTGGAFTSVTQKFTSLRDASDRAGKGLGKIGNILGDLARESLGATGPFGRLAEKVLEFGIGGGVVTAVAAGIAILGAGLNNITKSAREAQKAYDDWLDSLRKTTPLSIAGRQIDEVGHKLDRYNETGLRGKAVRITRDVLSGSLLGQIFGVKSKEELQAAFDEANEKYSGILIGNAAERKATNEKFAKQEKEELDRLARERKAAYEKWLNAPKLRQGESNNVFADSTRQGASAADQASGVTAANAGGASAAMQGIGGIAASIQPAVDGVQLLTDGFLQMGEGAQTAFDAAISGAEQLGVGMGGLKKVLSANALVHGFYDQVAAISAFARGLFGEVEQLKAAAALQASAARWFSLAAKYGGGGGSGGGGRGGSGGGLSAGGVTENRRLAEQGRSVQEVRIKAEPGALADPNSPAYYRTIAKAMQAAKYARVIEIDFTGAT